MTVQVDRRKFLKYSGAAGAATGALWVAPSVLGSSSAFAAGSCAYQSGLVWSNSGYAAGSQVPNRTSPISFTVQIPSTTPSGGPSAHVVVTVTPVGTPGIGGTGGGAGVYPPPTQSNGGINQPIGTSGGAFNGYTSYYMVSMTNNASDEGYDIKFDFYAGSSGTTPLDVYNLNFKLIDVDAYSPSNGYIDLMYVNGSFVQVSRGTKVSGSGTSTNPWYGTSTGGVTDDTGTVGVGYSGPVSTTTASYRSGTRFGTHQTIAITDLSWCY